MLLTKKFRFETAHRLAKGYVGKCAQLHGHSWNGHVKVKVQQTDEFDMGVDYAVIGRWCKELENRFDHKILLYEGDPLLVFLNRHFLEEDAGKQQWHVMRGVVSWPENPTSESLAKFAHSFFKRRLEEAGLEGKATIKAVVIEETCTTSCSYP